MMQQFDFQQIDLCGAYVIRNFLLGDSRGDFQKCFERDIYRKAGIEFKLNETFLSRSARNVIRGLHFQMNKPQAKIVSVPVGKAWDVIVDLRPDSETFMEWRSFELSGENHLSIYIPRGFAHGFASLSDDTIMLYQCDGKYDKATDTGIRFDDPDIGIEWPIAIENSMHSERDLGLRSIKYFMENNKLDYFMIREFK